MATKSRYMAYSESLKKNSERKEKNSTPKSILQRLSELKKSSNGGK